jgi:hypothetical protein
MRQFAEAEALVRQTFATPARPFTPHRGAPRLLYSLGTYNLVAYAGWFFALPQALGAIDLENEDPMGRPGVVVGSDLWQIENAIDALVE